MVVTSGEQLGGVPNLVHLVVTAGECGMVFLFFRLAYEAITDDWSCWWVSWLDV